MRVVHLGPYPPPHGGVQTNIVAIRDCLRRHRISCEVINLTRSLRNDVDGVYFPRNAFRVMWLLLRRRYDIIHLHIGGNVTLRLLAVCFFINLIPWTRTVLSFHSGGYPVSSEGKAAHAGTLRGLIFRMFDKVIAVNTAIEEMFHRFGLPRDRVQLIRPYSLAPKSPNVSLPLVMQNFFDTHRPVLLTVGLLEPEYDLTRQLDALRLAKQRFPEAGLVLIGSGSLEQELRTLIDTGPHGEHILLCGDVPHLVTLRAIEKADIFLRTTLYDGDSIAVREALHLGVPVIASENGMRPEGVHLIPPADLKALHRAIEQVLIAPSIRNNFRRETHEDNAERVVALYHEILDK